MSADLEAEVVATDGDFGHDLIHAVCCMDDDRGLCGVRFDDGDDDPEDGTDGVDCAVCADLDCSDTCPLFGRCALFGASR